MKKQRVKCPVCGVYFDPRIPFQHIRDHHRNAREHELSLIRDVRRQCFGQEKPVKQTSVFLQSSGLTSARTTSAKVTAR